MFQDFFSALTTRRWNKLPLAIETAEAESLSYLYTKLLNEPQLVLFLLLYQHSLSQVDVITVNLCQVSNQPIKWQHCNAYSQWWSQAWRVGLL